MSTGGCPNCGHDLVALREEEQPAQSRRVRLRWLICCLCRHVALDSWEFVDDSVAALGEQEDDLGNVARESPRRRAGG
jgi:predicted  nucleic acid-binding Zn-ribbon protein